MGIHSEQLVWRVALGEASLALLTLGDRFLRFAMLQQSASSKQL